MFRFCVYNTNLGRLLTFKFNSNNIGILKDCFEAISNYFKLYTRRTNDCGSGVVMEVFYPIRTLEACRDIIQKLSQKTILVYI